MKRRLIFLFLLGGLVLLGAYVFFNSEVGGPQFPSLIRMNQATAYKQKIITIVSTIMRIPRPVRIGT